MTNFQKWLAYTSDLPSPDNYIKWGFYYLISASLQRRVWCPPNHSPMYANMYVTLVGKPGIGKGGVIRAVSSILSKYKLKDLKQKMVDKGTNDNEKYLANSLAEKDLKNAQEDMDTFSNKASGVEEALLFPMGADAVTYEALVQCMARSLRHIPYIAWDDKLGSNRMKVYSHSSLAFCLEEVASLFRKNTESLLNFLIQCYDCSDNYEYRIKTGAPDRIRKVCLNFFGGAVPEFMQNCFDERLISHGYSSRTFYIFALKNRKSVFFRPELTDEQRQCRDEIAEHVFKLATLYGQVKIDPETTRWLQDWLEDFEANPSKRTSRSPKMDPFYARMNIHVMKLAMALHFGESTEMEIQRPTFERAIEIIQEECKTMHLALMLGNNNNPLSKMSGKVTDYLRDFGKRNFTELLAEFWEQGLRKPDLEEVLNFLVETDKIVIRQDIDSVTNEKHNYYEIK